MPDPAVHASFGQEVLHKLSGDIRSVLREEIYMFAQYGPDPWFTYQFWRRHSGRGRRMHTEQTGAFLLSLARHAKEGSSREEMFSYLAGFLCHYCLDSATHPYIVRRTTTEFHYPRCHMSFEHALDACQLKREGTWGKKHALTDHNMCRRQLPESMRKDLDAAYREVYGWENCWKILNSMYLRYRFCFRLMEPPEGILARLARATKSPVLKSLSYSESHFLQVDVENTGEKPWAHSNDDSIISTESFAALKEKAEARALRLISLCYEYVFMGKGTPEELAGEIGNDSYLSGLPVEDPRNLNVESMLPYGKDAEKQ